MVNVNPKSNWAAQGPAGSSRDRTEYWLMYERADGRVLRWMVFSTEDNAWSAIPDAERATHAVRWGVVTMHVTLEVQQELTWEER